MRRVVVLLGIGVVLMATATAVLTARAQSPASDEPDPPTPEASAPVFRCTTQALPVGRAANVWNVACALSGAPADDAGFEVHVFAPDGWLLCEGDLRDGAGSCGGNLTVPLDPSDAGDPPPLAFYALSQPSGATAAATAPVARPPCQSPSGNQGIASFCP
jgi:hypothetical protein